MLQDEEAKSSAIWTIGHSTRSLDAFLDLLARCRLEAVADVRRFPGTEVVHILDTEHAVVHPFTSPARVVQGRLSYVPAEGER